jgi:hypothetical protein
MNLCGISCSPIETEEWGFLTNLSLPGGGQLGVYQPRHARPIDMDTPSEANISGRRVSGGK